MARAFSMVPPLARYVAGPVEWKVWQQHVGGGRPAAPARRSITDENRKLVAPGRVKSPTFGAVANFSRAKGKLDLIVRDECSAWPARIGATLDFKCTREPRGW